MAVVGAPVPEGDRLVQPSDTEPALTPQRLADYIATFTGNDIEAK